MEGESGHRAGVPLAVVYKLIALFVEMFSGKNV